MKQVSYEIDENIKKLSDKDLLAQTDLLASEHRKNSVLLLRHLREVEVRRLFVDLGFSSMHKYCLQKLKFSEGETQRRLTSARLLTELPEIESKLETGVLNVTNLSKIQSFLRTEKAASHSLTKEEKLELVSEMENKSTREVEKELVSKSHQPALLAEKFQGPKASLLLGEEFQKFEALLGKEQQELLLEFKNLYAHELKDPGNGSILVFLLEKAVQYKKKKLGILDKKNTHAAPLPSAPEVKVRAPQRRAIKFSIKKAIWQRAHACCEFQDPKSLERCRSTYALELDHIRPVALGGSDDIENLQLLCRAHNSRRAVKTFGAGKVH